MVRMLVNDALVQLMNKEGLCVALVNNKTRLLIYKKPEPILYPNLHEAVGKLNIHGNTVDFDALMTIVRKAKIRRESEESARTFA